MLRFVHALVSALAVVLGTASGAHAFEAKTALRGNFESVQERVGAFGSQALGRRQQNPAAATTIASECSYAARGGSELVHLTTPANAAKIAAEGTLRGSGGIYAGPASNAAAEGLAITLRTGLSPGQAGAVVRIPGAAAGAFSRPIPIGPITLWQRLMGQQFTAAGSLNLVTGAFTRTGVNWNQVLFYGADATVVGATAAGAYSAFGD